MAETKKLLSRLIDHELRMATLYKAMARNIPGRAETLEQLATEENGHADMLRHLRDTFVSSELIKDGDIQTTIAQLDEQDEVVNRLTVQVEAGDFDEAKVIDEIVRLESTHAELEINRIVMENRTHAAFELFVEILDSEEAHEKILREW